MDVVRRNNVAISGRPEGPVVMLAHGFGCDQNMWRLVEPVLAERFQVVRFDYVGSGRSDPSAWDPRRSQDIIAPRQVGAFVHAAIPGSVLITLDATGHCPQLSAPDATARAIADFAGAARR